MFEEGQVIGKIGRTGGEVIGEVDGAGGAGGGGMEKAKFGKTKILSDGYFLFWDVGRSRWR